MPSPTPPPWPGSWRCSPTRAWFPSCWKVDSGEVAHLARPRPLHGPRPPHRPRGRHRRDRLRDRDRRAFRPAMAVRRRHRRDATLADRCCEGGSFDPDPGLQPASLGVAVVALAHRARHHVGPPERAAPATTRSRPPTGCGELHDVDLPRALGDDFDRLHPKMQWRFGFSSIDETCQIGHGVMDDVWRGPWWTLPFLLVGSRAGSCSRAAGRDVPFTIANYAYVDASGARPSPGRADSASRAAPGLRRHDDPQQARDTIVDYLGSHQHLAVDIALLGRRRRGDVPPQRRAALLRRAARVPLPTALLGHRRRPRVVGRRRRLLPHRGSRRQQLLGPLFGYHGSFTVEERSAPPTIPTDVLPIREEGRE